MKLLNKKLLIVTFIVGSLFVSFNSADARSLFSKEHLSTSYDEISYSPYENDSFDLNNYDESSNVVDEELEDEVTLGKTDSLGLKELSFRIAMLVLLLLGLSFIVKALLYKAEVSGQKLFNQPSGFFNGINDQFCGSFANLEGLKLRQMLSLTKGQNLYLVELDGKKILLGGTHMGGIQYVADLSDIKEKNISITDQLEENQKNEGFFYEALQRCNPFAAEEKSNNPEPVMTPMHQEQIIKANAVAENQVESSESYNPFKSTDDHMQEIEKDRKVVEEPKVEVELEKQHDPLEERRVRRKASKRPFKRRVSFRQSLITG